MPKISVIIPCYNQGHFLEEAVQSVLDQTFQDFEIIIVNDGSTDPNTIEILNNFNKPKTRILHTTNQKLPSARNNGIKEALGQYILPLDADDKIGPEYLELANNVLDENPEVGIVYCQAEFFGARNHVWNLPIYQFPHILLGNCIFCSALFRRTDWEKVEGYNPNMTYGFEDWDFWLSLINLGVYVHRIDKVLFYYRKHETPSMVEQLSGVKNLDMKNQIIANHRQLYLENIDFFTANIEVFLS